MYFDILGALALTGKRIKSTDVCPDKPIESIASFIAQRHCA